MKRELSALTALVSALSLSAGVALAADPVTGKPMTQTQSQDPIYGSQLMTPQERTEYGAKMRATKTADEREQIRKANHDQMTDRAKSRGVTLPDEPAARGDGMGRGSSGMGQGSGAMGTGGSGMGQGSGAMSPSGGSTGSGVTSGR